MRVTLNEIKPYFDVSKDIGPINDKIDQFMGDYVKAVIISGQDGEILYSKQFSTDKVQVDLLSNFIAASMMFGETNAGKIERIFVKGKDAEIEIVTKHNLILTILFEPNTVNDFFEKESEKVLDLFYYQFKKQLKRGRTNRLIYQKFDKIMVILMFQFFSRIKIIDRDDEEINNLLKISADFLIKIETEKELKAEVSLKDKYSFKILQVGNTNVGKTALNIRFTRNYFKRDLSSTLGIDFGMKEINCEYKDPNDQSSKSHKFKVNMNVWDIAGPKSYEQHRCMYYRNAKGIMLCYAIDNPQSFKDLRIWLDELDENLGRWLPIILVGTKSDTERRVPLEVVEKFAKKNKFIYLECSAKKGTGIEKIFETLALEIFRHYEHKEHNY